MTDHRDITLRPAQMDDAPALQGLAAHALGYDYPLADTRQRLSALLADDQQILLVAETEQGNVVGVVHASYYVTFYGPPAYNVMGLAVDAAYRGYGLGRQLMQALEDQVQARDVHHIRLNSGSHRTSAHTFYQAIGYTYTKDQKTFNKSF